MSLRLREVPRYASGSAAIVFSRGSEKGKVGAILIIAVDDADGIFASSSKEH